MNTQKTHPTGIRRALFVALGAVCATTILYAANSGGGALSDDELRWREKIGYNPQVHGALEQSSDTELFSRVPFAYYPYTDELEVAFDTAKANQFLSADRRVSVSDVRELRVSVFPTAIASELLSEMPFYYAHAGNGPIKEKTAVATGTIALDTSGRGHGVLKIPDLPVGNYRVEYEFGGEKLTASKTFRRTHFEWEHCAYGTEHKVYAPFVPITAKGKTVSVVDRTYTVNALGLFDSVVCKGRELLAGPMKLVAETEDGGQVSWSPGQVKGEAPYPDLAIFETSAKSEIGTLMAKTSIEEDGCARIQWTLAPAETPVTVKRMWLEIAVKETEAPLCHMVGMESLRHNYAGNLPRGGKITWINQFWRPARFEVEPFEGKAPDSYQVWEARQQMNWGIKDPKQQWNFAPYIWLGAEEQGIAWFGDHTQGYETDGKSSIQRLLIEQGKVMLRVELIQKPVTLDAPRTFEFGLQASPTKPMPADWRGKIVPGGGGLPVVVWGGFNCSDKVPANKDWAIVDKVLEGRKTGKADNAWFVEYAKTHHTVINEGGGVKPGLLRTVTLEEAKVFDKPWLTLLATFAGRAANLKKGEGITVYFEEHQTNPLYPEVAEFMDEWSDGTFARYRYFDYPRIWGPRIRSANPASYRDFAVFYANEWMKRGIGIYYDNTFPVIDRNREHFGDRGIAWSSSIWGHREYYKRVWKRSRELMEKGITPLPLHIVGHVTNCQVLPYTTWWDATLGVESPGQWQPDPMPSAEERVKQLETWPFLILPTPKEGSSGRALPYPPDYLRAMEMGRMAGLIPHYRHALRSEDAFGGLGIAYGSTDKQDEKTTRHRQLSDAGMGLVHEIRGGAQSLNSPSVGALRRALGEFGYGSNSLAVGGPSKVKVFNYWEKKPFVTVGNPQVKWIAMTREQVPFGMLLLQSYSPEATSTTICFPEATVFVDAETREEFQAGTDGSVTVSLPVDYGTRLLYALRSTDELKLLPKTPETTLVDDFELRRGFWATIRGKGLEVIADGQNNSNRVLH